MPSVLIPKYDLGRISKNYFDRSQGISLTQFTNDNFTAVSSAVVGIPPSSPVSQVNNQLLASIMVDYGNGPITIGMEALTLINRNVISGTQLSSDIFNNSIIFGSEIPFGNVTSDQGRQIVLQNLSMILIINVVSNSLQQQYYDLIDSIVADLKRGTYNSTNYSISLLRQSRIIAQSASRILNGTNI